MSNDTKSSHNTEPSGGSHSPLLDSTAQILVWTALTYAIAFAFEVSYLSHFGVPSSFAEVDLRSVLIFAGGMVLVLMAAANTFDLLNNFFPSLQSREIRWLIRRDSAFVVGVGVMTYLLNQVWWISAFFLTLAAILVLFDFYLAPRFVKTATSYRDRLQYHAGRLWNRPAEVTFIQRFDKRIGQPLLISSVLLLGGAVLGGHRYASNQEEFLLIGNCAVLKVRENYALCAELNGDKLVGTFHIFAIDDLVLTRAEAGPIKRYVRVPLLPAE